MKFRSSVLVRSTAVGLAVAVTAACFAGHPAAAQPDAQSTEANITRLTTHMMERSQFAHRPFDADLAGALLDRYMDTLDGTRSLFLQSDVDEFAKLRSTVASAARNTGDTTVAQTIYRRGLERLAQRSAYVTRALASGDFDFTGHDTYVFGREHAAHPRDAAAAEALWREQLRAEYLQEKLAGTTPNEIVATLSHRQAQQLRTMKELRSDEVLDLYLDALTHVYDPHSDYFGREQMADFSIAMNLSLYGIGATLESTNGYCTVRDLVTGGPAARSGLLAPGDRIVAVAQSGEAPVDVVDMPLSRLVDLIRGPKGSKVTLTVLPPEAKGDGHRRSVSIERDQVKLEDQEARAKIVDLPTSAGSTVRLGVVTLPSFYTDMGGAGADHRSATADVARLVTKLKAEHVRGVVLDLRRNGGGSLGEAISMVGLFIRKGPVVQTRDRAGHVEVDADEDPAVLYDGPLAVLTSRFTASASEILAGALQDYGRAVIVGDRSTFGKGTVQEVVPLARVMDQNGLDHAFDPGALKITTSKFYRPSGASTQLRGVSSDIVLPSTTDFDEIGESALADPLPWDTVASATYDHLGRVAPYLDALREGSRRRVAADKDFALLATDAARIGKNLATKTVSLNEAERRAEVAGSKARERELEAASSATQPTTYEITLENVDRPGLPRPVARIDRPTKTPSSLTDDLDAPATRSGRPDDELIEAERIVADYARLLDGSS